MKMITDKNDERIIKILYVHGYLGKGNGRASKLIKAELDGRLMKYVLDAPDFPVTEPGKMLKLLYALTANDRYDYVVASSLGAFYSLFLAGQKRILINPALPENLNAIKEKDPEGNSALTKSFLSKLNKCKDFFFNVCFENETACNTFFLIGEHDTIAPNSLFFKDYYTDLDYYYSVNMEHKLNAEGAEKVADIIEALEKDMNF